MWKPTPIAPGPLWQPTTGPTTVRAGSPETRGRILSTSSAAILGRSAWATTISAPPPAAAACDDAVDRPRIGPHSSDRLDDPLADLEDRLDVEHGAKQRASPADPSTAPQELEGLDREEHPFGALHRRDRSLDHVGVTSGLDDPHRLADGSVVPDRDAARVDHADVQFGQRRSGLRRRRVGAAEVGGDGRADDRAAVRPQLAEDVLEFGRGRLRGPRERAGGCQAGVELLGRDIHAVEIGLIPEDHLERDHAHRMGGAKCGLEIGGAVAHQVDRGHRRRSLPRRQQSRRILAVILRDQEGAEQGSVLAQSAARDLGVRLEVQVTLDGFEERR